MGRMKDFGKKNKGGKLDIPTQLKTDPSAAKRLHLKTPEQN